MSTAAPATKPIIEARIYGESPYDRATSFLLAVILGAAIVFGWLSVIAATTSAYQSRATRPVQVIEVSGGGGGDARRGAEQHRGRRRPGGRGGRQGVQQRGGGDRLRGAERRAPPLGDAGDRGRGGADPRRGRRLDRDPPGHARSPPAIAGPRSATVGPATASGPGDGGVRREDRWSIQYRTGQTAEEYARQLDAFGVELAIVAGNQLVYVVELLRGQPDHPPRFGRRRQAALLRLAGAGEARRPTSPCSDQGRPGGRRGGDLPVLPRRRSRRPWSNWRSATRADSPPRSGAPASASSRPGGPIRLRGPRTAAAPREDRHRVPRVRRIG